MNVVASPPVIFFNGKSAELSLTTNLFFLLFFLSEVLAFMTRFTKPHTLSVRCAIDSCARVLQFATNLAVLMRPAFICYGGCCPAGFQASCLSRNALPYQKCQVSYWCLMACSKGPVHGLTVCKVLCDLLSSAFGL